MTTCFDCGRLLVKQPVSCHGYPRMWEELMKESNEEKIYVKVWSCPVHGLLPYEKKELLNIITRLEKEAEELKNEIKEKEGKRKEKGRK